MLEVNVPQHAKPQQCLLISLIHTWQTRIIYAIQIGELVEIHVTVNSFDTVIGKLINRYVCIQPKLYLYLYILDWVAGFIFLVPMMFSGLAYEMSNVFAMISIVWDVLMKYFDMSAILIWYLVNVWKSYRRFSPFFKNV